MSDPAGTLNIQLERTSRGLACRIASTRPVTAADRFAGRAPAATAALLPLLYSICAKAQAFACVASLEGASGRLPAPAVVARRQRMVSIETIREHLWRILLDWPRLLGETPDRATMAKILSLVKELFRLSDSDGDLFRPGASSAALDRRGDARVLADLDDLLARQVFGAPPNRWLDEVRDGGSFDRWLGRVDTCAARLLRGLLDADEATLGQADVAGLPELRDADLIALIDAPEGADFLARPTWDGVARETSPFTRRAGCGLIRDLIDRHGRGLLSRLAAQLLEVALLLAEVRRERADEMPTPFLPPAPMMAGTGIGRADAARGLLVHLARVEREQVTKYRILAPTEWNFHPQGILAHSLAALPDAADDVLRRQAELLIMATDPCVAFDLTLSEPRA
ncbi:nickel-dependent hydrogenase large subunit [Thiocystis violascens]|uniref:Coenzyme F420-reducing hydrogenase, alpha subunit n=1 Tax=Thiocystis violascens (strain ATCC 17096 / DSM 198 / 6111) TaxID=765911 RepID=I3YEX8_THIV6|nr:nickel-dependent hydrogenase large subunit [Thiocystis violascens]AFL75546.1 coenzyme F420-reducing hydrogenase, alpha subunit [Thiocystis violascens DSM 198]